MNDFIKVKCDRCGQELILDIDHENEYDAFVCGSKMYHLCKQCCKEVQRFIVEGRYYNLD
jgi:hypothetical protein